MRKPLTLKRRAEIVTEISAELEFKPLVWSSTDCGKMTLKALRAAGRRIRISKFGPYGDEAGARAALEGQGYADLPDILEELGLEPIAPASRLPADLIGFPVPDGLTAMGLACDNGAVLALHQASGCWRKVRPVFTAQGPDGEVRARAWRLS